MNAPPHLVRRLASRAAIITSIAIVAPSGAHAQSAPKGPKPLPAPALLLAPLAGQPIAVLPATYVITDGNVTGLPGAHAALVTWVDSVVGEMLQARGPEAKWILPAEVRRIARRAPGIVTDPDQMGQAAMRFNGLKQVPDPLLSNIRALVALTGSRYVMIPAAFRFYQTPAGVRAEATLLLVDARNGSIPWHSSPVIIAPTAAAALAGTIAWVLPDLH